MLDNPYQCIILSTPLTSTVNSWRLFRMWFARLGTRLNTQYWCVKGNMWHFYILSLMAPGNNSLTNVDDYDDVIKWKHFPRNWLFVRGIHRSPVNSPHKGQYRGALMFSSICTWINGWVHNHEAGDLRWYRAHYDVIEMAIEKSAAYRQASKYYPRWMGLVHLSQQLQMVALQSI